MNVWDGAKKGSYDMVRAMLEDNPVWANTKDDRDIGPLSYAVVGGHRHMVELLLKYKANPNLETSMSLPITLAAMTGDAEVVKLLLANNAHVRQANKQGFMPIHAAAAAGKTEVCKVFAAHDKRLLHITTDVSEKTPLYLAVEEGFVETAKYLHSEGVSLKTLPADKKPLLHAAAAKGNVEMCRWLISVGENPNEFGLFNEEMLTPLHVAAACAKTRVAKFLIEECKAEVEAETEDKWTPLQYCAQSGHEKLCELLVGAGASLSHQTAAQCIPLISAAAAGKANLAKLFLEKDRSVIEHRSIEDRTPLHYAISSNDLATVEILIKHGANVNAVSNTDISPLHGAVRGGNLQIIDLLVKHDASLRIADSVGNTPLHAAALSNNPAAFVLLARLGADSTAQNTAGQVPIDLFESASVKETVRKELEMFGDKQVNVDALRKCSRGTCTNYEMHEGQFNRCSRCKSSKYCSASCQKEDWATHKKTCKPVS